MIEEVVCINCEYSKGLTLDKLYEVINDYGVYNYYRIINDYGAEIYYYKIRFKTFDKIREETIN